MGLRPRNAPRYSHECAICPDVIQLARLDRMPKILNGHLR